MASKLFFSVFLVAIIRSDASVPVAAPVVSDSTYDPLPQYYFGYDVQDALTGDSKSQVETRNGDVVVGQYSLNDPDGTRRIVDYSSDALNGFNAVVRKAQLAVATPVVAAAAPTPVVEPVAVRAVAAPLVAASALRIAAPTAIATVPSPLTLAALSAPVVAARALPGAVPATVPSAVAARTRAAPVSSPLPGARNVAGSALVQQSSGAPKTAPLPSDPSPFPSSAPLQRSAPLPSENPRHLPSIPQSRYAQAPSEALPLSTPAPNPFPFFGIVRSSISSPPLAPSPSPSVPSSAQLSNPALYRSVPASPARASSSALLRQPASVPSGRRFPQFESDSVEIRSAALETELPAPSSGPRSAQVAAPAPVAAQVPVPYAAAPALAYAGPVAYNLW